MCSSILGTLGALFSLSTVCNLVGDEEGCEPLTLNQQLLRQHLPSDNVIKTFFFSSSLKVGERLNKLLRFSG
jgi:hypothetical protein